MDNFIENTNSWRQIIQFKGSCAGSTPYIYQSKSGPPDPSHNPIFHTCTRWSKIQVWLIAYQDKGILYRYYNENKSMFYINITIPTIIL